MFEEIPIGVLTALTRNQIYSLPSKVCTLYTNTAGAVFQQSNDSAFASTTAVTLTEGKYEVAAAFIRATNVGGALVILKAM
jgi:hypothetical protein